MSLASIRARDPLAGFAIARTLGIEGGFTDDTKDPGGATNHGVSLRFALQEIGADPSMVRMFDVDHDGHVDRADIAGLTQDGAADVYFNCWWGPGWYGRIGSQLVAWKCFDISVNTGPKRSALILQKGLQGLSSNTAVDAVVGPATLMAVAAQVRRDNGVALLNAVRAGQASFYRGLAAREPKLERFLGGWLKRAAL